MDGAKESDSSVNIHLERRKRPLSQRETSHYFEPSTTNDGSEGEESPKRANQRQARLSFKNGHLVSKAPFSNPDSNEERRERLSSLAAETVRLLPGLLATRPDAPPDSFLCKGKSVEQLDPNRCPNLPSTKIRVINADSIDAALSPKQSKSSKPPIILNMANARSAGGGWKHGSLAQEECLCYRTSLSATLRYKFYPLPELSAIYSPTVLVIRESMKDGNALLDVREPKHLEVVSVVSAAAICQPPLKKAGNVVMYDDPQDEKLMAEKIRVILRTAIRNGHRHLVLGAFGCGAFGNPKGVVAAMFLRILREQEFTGGWFTDVVFAVLDDGRGNYQEFKRVLDGQAV